jgi:hypothetical protein
MNPNLDKLVQFLSANPKIADTDIFKSFPQLKGNSDLTRRARAYAMGKASGEYDDADLDHNFSDVITAFTPKETKVKVPQLLSTEPVPDTMEAHSSPLQPVTEPKKEPSDDPLGDNWNEINNRKRLLTDQYGRRDATAVSHPPQVLHDVSTEMGAINGRQKQILNVVQKSGADVSTQDAAQVLNHWVKQKDPHAPDVSGLSTEQIAALVPNTMTAKSVLKRYQNNRTVFESFASSPTIEQAAIKWAKQNDPNISKQLDAQTDGTDNPNLVAGGQMGTILKEFLSQPGAQEWAQRNPKNLQSYKVASYNLENNFPELKESRIVNTIAQRREDSGQNSAWYNAPGKESTDSIVDQLIKEGKLSPQDKSYYEKNIREKLGFWRGLGRDVGNVIPGVNALVNDNPIPTTGALENVSGGLKSSERNMARGLEDMASFTPTSQQATNEPYVSKDVQAKTFLHNLSKSGGHMIGSIIPIVAGAEGLGADGAALVGNAKLANGLMFGLSTLDDSVKESMRAFPDDPLKRVGYVTAMTGFNTAMGEIFPDGKGTIGQGLRDDVKHVIENFAEGNITREAAADALKKTFYDEVKEKAPQYLAKVMEHNMKGGALMTLPTIVDHTLKTVLDGGNENDDLTAGKLFEQFASGFLASSPISMFSAHSDVSQMKTAARTISDIADSHDYYKNVIDWSNIKNKSEILQNLDDAVAIKKDLESHTELTDKQKEKALLQELNVKVLQRRMEATTSESVKDRMKELIKQSKEETQRILNQRDAQLEAKAERAAGKENEPVNQDNLTTHEDIEKARIEEIRGAEGLMYKYYEDILKDPNAHDFQKEIAKEYLSNPEKSIEARIKYATKDLKKNPGNTISKDALESSTRELEKLKEINAKYDKLKEEAKNVKPVEPVEQPQENASQETPEQQVQAQINVDQNLENEELPEGDLLNVIDKESTEPYKTQNGKYTVSVENGRRVVRDENGNEPSQKTAKKYLDEHAEQYNYNNGKSVYDKKAPQFSNEQEASQWVAENSENPSEIADIYTKTEKQPVGLSNKEQAIASHGIGKVKQSSYEQFGDTNNRNNSKARTYFSKEGMSVDAIAKTISDHSGLDITPQDVIDFIDRFPNGGNIERPLDTPVHEAAKRRFEEITGIPLSEDVAAKAAAQLYTPEQKAQAQINVDHALEIQPLPEEELLHWLNEESQKEFDDNETSNNLEYEPANTERENHAESQTQGSVQQGAGSKKATGTSENVRPIDPQGTSEVQSENSPRESTGIKNRIYDQERTDQGKEVIDTSTGKSKEQLYQETAQKIESGEIKTDHIRAIAKEIAEGREPSTKMSTVELQSALIHDKITLNKEREQTVNRLNEAYDSGDKEAIKEALLQQNNLEQQMEHNYVASKKTGTEWSEMGRARQTELNSDYSVAHTLGRFRAANLGEDIPENTRKSLAEKSDAIAEKEKQGAEVLKEKEEQDKAILQLEEEKKQLEEANKKLEAELALERTKREAFNDRQAARGIKKEKLGEQKKAVKEDLKRKWKKFSGGQLNSGLPLPVEMIPDIAKLARIHVMEGITTLEGLIDAIQTDLSEFMGEVDRRAIMDAFSGYGKMKKLSDDAADIAMRDLQAQARELSKLQDLEEGKHPLRSGMQREKPSDEVRELRRKVNQAMKEAGIEVTEKTPEEAQRTALDAIKTRLRNQITDIQKQIDTGEKAQKKTGVPYDEEATDLKALRDELLDTLHQITGKPEMSDEQRISIALKAADKSIKEYQRRIAENDLKPKQKGSKTPETPELKEKTEFRDSLKKQLDKMIKDAKPGKTKEEIAQQAYETKLLKKKAYLENIKETKNIDKYIADKKRNQVVLTEKLKNLKADSQKTKIEIDTIVKQRELKNRGAIVKGLDWFSKFRRSVLITSFQTFEKLAGAAMWRPFLKVPEEIIGFSLSKIPGLSKIAKGAPVEGIMTGKDLAESLGSYYAQLIKAKTYKQAWRSVVDGKSQEEILYDKPSVEVSPTDWVLKSLEYVGRSHSAIKYPIFKAEMESAVAKIMAYEIREHGANPNDLLVQEMVKQRALMEGLRAKFSQDNNVVKIQRMVEGFLEKKGHVRTATAIKAEFPITKIASNYLSEASSMLLGGVRAAPKLIQAIAKGADSLTPEQKDFVMRNLKKQGIGVGLWILGYFCYGNITPFYGSKKKQDDEEDTLFGIPHLFTHNPAAEIMRAGSSYRWLKEMMDEKGKEMSGTRAFANAGAQILKESPYVGEGIKLMKTIDSKDVWGSVSKFAGEFIRSTVIPPDVQNLAKYMDKDEDGNPIKRKPHDFIDNLKSGTPGLREDVPTK